MYSAASMLLRRASAAAQSWASNEALLAPAACFLDFVAFAILPLMSPVCISSVRHPNADPGELGSAWDATVTSG